MVRPRTVNLGDTHVKVEWSDGHASVFANRALREACPCALCRGESGLLGKVYMLPTMPDVPPDVRPTGYTMVGLYAIAFNWSDGHTTGIYPYDYLLGICECERCRIERTTTK